MSDWDPTVLGYLLALSSVSANYGPPRWKAGMRDRLASSRNRSSFVSEILGPNHDCSTSCDSSSDDQLHPNSNVFGRENELSIFFLWAFWQ